MSLHTLYRWVTTRRLQLLIAGIAACIAAFSTTAAHAASSWSPTLLVNTEAFQEIDDGDGTSDMELRFGTSTKALKFLYTRQIFQFTHGISVLGTISGSSLNVDRNATVGGTLTVTGAITGVSTITAKSTLSGARLRVSGNADIHGALAATGAIRTDSDLTINDDAGAVDAVLTFGNASGNQTLKFLNTRQIFQFSKGISVLGTISGSSLNVDRNATVGGTLTVTGAITGVSTITAKTILSGNTLVVSNSAKVSGTLSASGTVALEGHLTGATIAGFGLTSCNSGGQMLQWNSATQKFECGVAASVGNGSGGILSLHPEYPNAVFFGSGANTVGQLIGSGGTTALDNSYVWTSSRASLQDYWISVRVRLPDNFSSWDPVKPIELRYKTADGTSTNNHVTVRIKDTTGANIALTGGGGLASASWTTASVTGPQASGTWTPKGYLTLYIKLAALTGGNAAVGFVNFNFETTTP